MTETKFNKTTHSIIFGNDSKPTPYDDLMGHCLISGDDNTGKTSAAFLMLAQHIAAGGNFLYIMNDQSKISQIAKLLAITGLSHSRHHVHHLHLTPKQPLKPFFIQPFLSGCSSVIVSPASDSCTQPSESDYHTVVTASLNLLSLKLTIKAAYPQIPRILVIDQADNINDRLLSDVLSRAKMAGVMVFLLLSNPEEKPFAVSAAHFFILLKHSPKTDEMWHTISGLPIHQAELSIGQAYVFAKKGYPESPLIRDWSPFHILPEMLA